MSPRGEKATPRGEDTPPPPPPPPPGMPGMPGPPPPPGMLVGPKKPVIKPNVKMRQMNWTKILPRQIKGTIWEDLDDEEVLKVIDKEEIESLFAAKAAKSVAEK